MSIKWETVLSVVIGSLIFKLLWDLFLGDMVSGVTGTYDRNIG